MSFLPPAPSRRRRLLGIGATVLAHLAVVGLWQMSARQPARDGSPPARAFDWVTVRLTPPAPVPRPPAARPAAAPGKRAAPRARAPAPSASLPASVSAGPAAGAPQALPAPDAPVPPSAAPASPGAADILAQARRDAGTIDSQLRQQDPGKPSLSLEDTPHKRMARGMELAADLARPKWYEGAKITESKDQSGYGRRIYRVVTSRGVHCLMVESHHSPTAHLDIGKRLDPKATNCPRE